MKKQKVILYWHLGKSSFVIKDLDILITHFIVKDFYFKPKKNLSIVWEFLKQIFICLHFLFYSNIVICQFAGYHSLIPALIFRVFGKKVIIIAGGTDCVAFPSINYGNFQKKYLKWFTKKSFQLANIISPVDETLVIYNYTYQDNDYPQQGYRFHIKKINAKEEVIHNGYDSTKFNILPATRLPHSFLTVAANLETETFKQLKGIDLIIWASKQFPNYTFTIIGGKSAKFHNKPDNLILLDFVKNEELPKLYNSYAFYLQLSMSEGFPNALCEAMLCGCIPIVSNVGAMPKIVGNTGFILKRKDNQLFHELISQAIHQEDIELLRKNAREQIVTNYFLSKRKTNLLNLVNTLTK